MSTFIQAFKNKLPIVIPPIQREYVQPLDKNIINGFIETLLKSFSTDTPKDLNYLYGVNKKDGFEPIDGQQRLTTLWLLHLYIAAANGVCLGIRLEYKTRDFAADFCDKLYENALSWIKHSGSISAFIIDSPWFITSWLDNITVTSILNALDVIDSRVSSLNCDPKTIWKFMTLNESPVTFAFKDTEDLGDDIYVKMNARGKALSDFENLKSWLDDQLCNLVKANKDNQISYVANSQEIAINEHFLESWRSKIDNEWTDLFWENRNRNDDFPEEIDDEQLRLFYSIALILWAAKSSSEKNAILKKGVDIKDIIHLLEDDKKKTDQDVSYLLGRMRRSIVDMPLYVLDKTNIFNEEFFSSAYKILNGLIRYKQVINSDVIMNSEDDAEYKIYFWSISKNNIYPISFMCQLLMSEKNDELDYRKLVLGAALCYYVSNSSNKADLTEWMRFARNIIYNIRIDEENVHNVLKAIEKWARACESNEMNDVIKNLTPETAIDSIQIKEEKEKIQIIKDRSINIKKAIFKLENHRFFLGRIRYLLEISKEFKPEEFEEKFLFYAEMLEKVFTDDGPIFTFGEHGFLMHRVLLALSGSYGYGYWYKRSWCLLESREEWKKYFLEDFETDKNDNQPHNIGLKNLIDQFKSPNQITAKSLKAILSIRKPLITDWRRELIAHPGLWNYMGNLCLKWKDNYNVVLIPGVVLQDTGRRSELRTRALYLDLKHDIFKSPENKSPEEEYKPFGWSLKFWDRNEGGSHDKNSCLYFEKNIHNNTIAIDVYFNASEATIKETEEAYCIEIFARNKNNISNEDIFSINGMILNMLLEEIKNEVERDNEEGRLFIKHLSKQRTIEFLKEFILPKL